MKTIIILNIKKILQALTNFSLDSRATVEIFSSVSGALHIVYGKLDSERHIDLQGNLNILLQL